MQSLLPSLQILDGRKRGSSQQAFRGHGAETEPVTAKKRKSSFSESGRGALEDPEGHVTEKAAKRRSVTFAEQREEFPQRNEEVAGSGQTGRGLRISQAKQSLHASKRAANLKVQQT